MSNQPEAREMTKLLIQMGPQEYSRALSSVPPLKLFVASAQAFAMSGALAAFNARSTFTPTERLSTYNASSASPQCE